MNNRQYLFVFIFLISISKNALSESDWQLPEFNGLIAGAISQDNLPYAQVSTIQNPSLLIFGRLGDVFIEGNRAGLLMTRFGFGSLSVIGQLRTHQYLDASKTSLTNQDRDKAIEIGPQLSIPLGGGFVSQFSVLQDISNTHTGQEYEAAIYKRFIFDQARIIATVSAQYQNKDLTDYYVGTPTYQAKADLTQEIELLGVYDVNDQWSVIALWRYYQHGDQIKNSPLTQGDFTERMAIGVGYQF